MFNKVIMMGRLTHDPKIYQKEDGSTKISASYSLAVQRSYDRRQVDFFRCAAFGKSAEFVEKYLKKGMKILVEGSMYTDAYTNDEGQNVRTATIYVNRHIFCDSRKEEPSPDNADSDFQDISDSDGPDLPFLE